MCNFIVYSKYKVRYWKGKGKRKRKKKGKERRARANFRGKKERKKREKSAKSEVENKNLCILNRRGGSAPKAAGFLHFSAPWAQPVLKKKTGKK